MGPSRLTTFAGGSVTIGFDPRLSVGSHWLPNPLGLTLRIWIDLKKINPRSIRLIRVFSRYATGMKEIRDAVNL